MVSIDEDCRTERIQIQSDLGFGLPLSRPRIFSDSQAIYIEPERPALGKGILPDIQQPNEVECRGVLDFAVSDNDLLFNILVYPQGGKVHFCARAQPHGSRFRFFEFVEIAPFNCKDHCYCTKGGDTVLEKSLNRSRGCGENYSGVPDHPWLSALDRRGGRFAGVEAK